MALQALSVTKRYGYPRVPMTPGRPIGRPSARHWLTRRQRSETLFGRAIEPERIRLSQSTEHLLIRCGAAEVSQRMCHDWDQGRGKQARIAHAVLVLVILVVLLDHSGVIHVVPLMIVHVHHGVIHLLGQSQLNTHAGKSDRLPEQAEDQQQRGQLGFHHKQSSSINNLEAS